MNIKEKLTENWKTGAVGAVSAVLLSFLFLITPLGNGLTRLSFDFPYAFPVQTKWDEVRIIYMDEDSHEKLFQHPGEEWHRALHTQLLKELARQKAKVVVFDVLFDKPFENLKQNRVLDPRLVSYFQESFGVASHDLSGKVVDQNFTQAIMNFGKVVVAGSHKGWYDERGNWQNELRRPEESLGSNIIWGVVEFPDEADKRIRQHNFDPEHESLAWKTAKLAGMKLPAERLAKRWLHYYGPRKRSIAACSYAQVLTPGALPPDYFSGKVVFIGKEKVVTPEGTTRDEYPTPYTRWEEEDLPGVELQATAYLNLVHDDWLIEMSPYLQFLLLLLLGTALGYGFTLVRPWIAAAWSVVAFLAVAGVALLLFWHMQVWFPWLIYGVVEIPTALAWAILANTKRLYHEKEVLEETLSKVRESGVHPSTAGLPAGQFILGNPDPAMGEKTQLIDPNVATAVGPQIANYDLVRRIGGGAYGEVWLCKDILGSYHAAKIIFRHKFSSNVPFEREFKGLQRFSPISRSHPGLVHVLHVGKNDPEGYFYYIMELGDDQLHGQEIDPQTYAAKNLATELERRERIPFPECLQLSLALAAALDVLHQQNLVHRDIKPSNIIFVKGAPKIADIGLVAGVAEDRSLVGTPGFMAPDARVTPAADVYSLGKVIYEAAIGRGQAQFPELPTNLIEWPDHKGLFELNKVILKACETSASLRYKTAGEMHAALRSLQSTLQ